MKLHGLQWAKMNKKVKQALLLLTILVFPSLFYVILSTGKQNIARVPFYGPRQVDPENFIKRDIPDTIYYTVPNTEFIDSENNTFGWEAYNDQILILHFFCTSCYNENYRVLEQMGKLYDRFNDKPEVTLVTVLIDSADTWQAIDELSEYAMGKSEKWKVVRLANSSWETFLVDDLKLQEPNPRSLVVLDEDRHIRGQFDGLQYIETNSAIDVVKALRFSFYRSTK